MGDPQPLDGARRGPDITPFCAKCGSMDGYLGTSGAYFCCRTCSDGQPVYWTPDHQHPNDWNVAILASPFGRKSEVLQNIALDRQKLAEAKAEIERLSALPAQDEARLRELAKEGAWSLHLAYCDGGVNAESPHAHPFNACAHPDCVLVRSAALRPVSQRTE